MLQTLLRIDRIITSYYYKRSFGKYLEHAFFVPGSWSGIPICFSVLLPTILWAVINHSMILPAVFVFFLVLTVISVQIMCNVLHDFMYNVISILLHFPLLATIALVDEGSFPYIAYYSISLWFTLIPIGIVKKLAGRIRPLRAYDDYDIKKKQPAFWNYLEFLRNEDSLKSFPSADVATTVVFSRALTRIIHDRSVYLVQIYVLLSATGRMYYGAHHFSDVIMGGLIAYFVSEYVATLPEDFSPESVLQIYLYATLAVPLLLFVNNKIEEKNRAGKDFT